MRRKPRWDRKGAFASFVILVMLMLALYMCGHEPPIG
jgi:predicted small lipoprotein YifL